MYHAQTSYTANHNHAHRANHFFSPTYTPIPFHTIQTATLSYHLESNGTATQYTQLNLQTHNAVPKPVYEVKPRANYITKVPETYNTNPQTPQPTTQHIVTPFLQSHLRSSIFINTPAQVQDLVAEIFEGILNRPMHNVIIQISTVAELQKIHPNYTTNILGFALNGNGTQPHRIFIKADYLDSIMLTIGHEIGHILTPTLERTLNEEAKAFAFECAWFAYIKQYNVGNLAQHLALHLPAANGVHDVALKFVLNQIRNGKDAIEVFEQIAKKELQVPIQIEELL